MLQNSQAKGTCHAVNSQGNNAGAHKSPRGAHTGAHLKCCKFSRKERRSPQEPIRAQEEPTPEPT